MVIPALSGGTPGRYFEMGSLVESLPSISSARTAAAVNCLVTEPMHETRSVVYACCASRFARP